MRGYFCAGSVTAVLTETRGDSERPELEFTLAERQSIVGLEELVSNRVDSLRSQNDLADRLTQQGQGACDVNSLPRSKLVCRSIVDDGTAAGMTARRSPTTSWRASRRPARAKWLSGPVSNTCVLGGWSVN